MSNDTVTEKLVKALQRLTDAANSAAWTYNISLMDESIAEANEALALVENARSSLTIANAEIEKLREERDQYADMCTRFSRERSPDGMEELAADRDRHFERANTAESQVEKFKARIEELLAGDLAALEETNALKLSLNDHINRVAELEAGLEPFAAVADEYDDREDDHFEVWKDAGPVRVIRSTFELRKYRLARALLQKDKNHG